MFKRLMRFVLGPSHQAETGLFRPGAMTPKEPNVQLLVPIDGTWLGAASVTAAQLWDHYLTLTTPEEEVLAAAVWVHADGKPWNRPEDSEAFEHVESWLHAVTALCQEDSLQTGFVAGIWAWEESGMQAFRHDNLVFLEERTHHVQARLPPVCFPLRSFAMKLLDETRSAVELISGMKQIAQEQCPTDWQSVLLEHDRQAAEIRDARPMSEQQMDAALAHLEEIERAQRLAIKQPGYRASPSPTPAEQQTERLHQVLRYLAQEGLSSAWHELAGRTSR